jgi:hypothetical protein
MRTRISAAARVTLGRLRLHEREDVTIDIPVRGYAKGSSAENVDFFGTAA